jgi:hypothetical protein
MLKQIYDDKIIDTLYYSMSKLEQVSDRNAIEKLLQLMDSKISYDKFNIYLDVLRSISHNRVISLVEVHERILLVNNVSYDYRQERQSEEEKIFNLLVNLSCIDNKFVKFTKTKFFTESDIDEEYKREIEDIDNNSFLFLRRNYYLNNSRLGPIQSKLKKLFYCCIKSPY